MESAFEYEIAPEDYSVMKSASTLTMPFFSQKDEDGPFHFARSANKVSTNLQSYSQLILVTPTAKVKQKKMPPPSPRQSQTPMDLFFNGRECVAEIIDLIMANSATSGSFIAGILVQLAQNPGIATESKKVFQLKDTAPAKNTWVRSKTETGNL